MNDRRAGARGAAAALLLGGMLAMLPRTSQASTQDCAGGGSIVLSSAAAQWQYLDTGTNSGTAWRETGFDATGWGSGPAPLGYDDEMPLATTIGFGPDPVNKYITAWFRREFVVTNPAYYQRLLLRALRDDGVIVYLNGVEVWRDNMPAGEVAAGTLAAGVVEEGYVYHPADFSFPLREGTNVLAAEVHQWHPASSDLLFDLELRCTIVRGPYLQRATTTNMLVRWRTPAPTDSLVQFGTRPDEMPWSAGSTTFTNDHSVLLTNLAPGTRYFYRVGNCEQIVVSGPELYFQTPPVLPGPTRIWVIGDCGAVNWSLPNEVMGRAVRDAYRNFTGSRHTDVWLMLGDNAYNEGYDGQYQTGVFNVYQSMLARTPAWSTIGNHEAYSLTPDGRMAYYDIFSPPMNGEAGGVASGTKNYYSFNHHAIHFVCLDSMVSDRSPNGVMRAWLEQDLAGNTNDWLIAFWHHPPYSRGSHDSDDTDFDPQMIEMRQTFLPILESYGVDLVLTGHSHSYERSFLLDGHYGYSATLQPGMIKDTGSGRPEDTGAYRKAGTGPEPRQGAVYVVTGSSSSTTGGTLDHPAMFVSLDRLGSLVVDVDGSRLDASFLRETGAVDDHFTILKGAPAEPLRMVVFSLKNGVATLKWKSEAGRTYRVERTDRLPPAGWTPATAPITASGATTATTFPVSPQARQTFYRVVVVGQF